MITDKALHRVRVLAFWEKHGIEATLEAFDVKKRTLYIWKQKLQAGRGRLEALNDESRTPQTKRTRTWPGEVIEEIKRIRFSHPNLGKEKIHPLLSAYCNKSSLECPSITTIGRLIKDQGGLRMFPQKISHFGKVKPIKRRKRLRKPKNLQIKYPGNLVALDTIEEHLDGNRRYIVTFEDI